MSIPAASDAVVTLQTGEDKLAAMRALMGAALFAESLRSGVREASGESAGISVAVKVFVDYSVGENQVDFSTDPELVDLLADEIGSAGVSSITVLVDKLEGAERYISRLKKANYTVSSMADQPEVYDFGSFAGEMPVAKAWVDADFRISFGKVRTSRAYFYEATITNVGLGLAGPVAAGRRQANGLRPRRSEQDVLLTDRLPVHFGFADAWLSADGPRARRLRSTRTLLAAKQLLALDWVAGEKMGLDPTLNPVIQEAMYRWGTMHLIREGNTTPWAGWKNVSTAAVVWNNL
jgi:uncharacterized protein (DUF362 family)